LNEPRILIGFHPTRQVIQMHNMKRKITTPPEQRKQRHAVGAAAHTDGPGAGRHCQDRWGKFWITAHI
jgi:hypothetical protein